MSVPRRFIVCVSGAFADVVDHVGDRAGTAPPPVRRGDPSPRFSLTPVY